MSDVDFREGDWFRVPVASDVTAVGRLARLSADKGVGMGYFFAPVDVSAGSDAWQMAVTDLSAEDCLPSLRFRFGTTALESGDWQVLLPRLPWDRTAWPSPAFVSVSPLSGVATRVEYDEIDLSRHLSQQIVSAEAAETLPRDALCSAKAVQSRIARALEERPV